MEPTDKSKDPAGKGTLTPPPIPHKLLKAVKKSAKSYWPYMLPGMIVMLLCFILFKSLQGNLIYYKAGKTLIKNYYHTPGGIIRGEVSLCSFQQ
jgi:hypothetical protein